jgi:hypothetical protein
MYLPKLPNCEKGVLETHVMATLGKYFKIVPTVKVPHGPEPMTRKEFGVVITRRKVLGWNSLSSPLLGPVSRSGVRVGISNEVTKGTSFPVVLREITQEDQSNRTYSWQ